MAIHYDAKSGRFRDGSGHFVSKATAMRSSIARREYDAHTAKTAGRKASPAVPSKSAPKRVSPAPATPTDGKRKPSPAVHPGKPSKVSHAKPAKPAASGKKGKPQAPTAAKPSPAKPKQARKRPRSRPSPRIAPPWEGEGDIREYPAPSEWFPDVGAWDYDYGYDDLADDWGDYEDDDTTSGGDGGED